MPVSVVNIDTGSLRVNQWGGLQGFNLQPSPGFVSL